MSRQNPLQPKSSLLEKNAKSRSGLQMVMIIVAVHVVFLGGLLFSGCSREEAQPAATGETNTIPTLPPMGEVATPPTPATDSLISIVMASKREMIVMTMILFQVRLLTMGIVMGFWRLTIATTMMSTAMQ